MSALPEQLTARAPEAGAEALACHLCAHRCVLRPGRVGICGAIEHHDGVLRSLTYGHPVVLHADPVERKPLYHLLPGARLLSLGTLGCNMTCDFCQNWRISQARPDRQPGAPVAPDAVLAAALAQGCAGVAFTYNEPTIYLDYAAEIMGLAQRAGLVTAFKSNGYLTPEAIELLTCSPPPGPLDPSGTGARLPQPPAGPTPRAQRPGGVGLLDAINIDLKGFDDGYYRRVCGARLQPVCDAIVQLHRRGVWVEVSTLIIPGVNDGAAEITALAAFLASISPDLPWHVWRFHPDYRLRDRPWTHVDEIERAIGIGRAAGLRYVYASNLPGDPNQHTRCPGCGALLIERVGEATLSVRLREQRCAACGWRVPGILSVATRDAAIGAPDA